MIPIPYAVRNLVARKTTTAAAALGLGLVVFVLASVMMLANGVRQATRRAGDPNGAIVLRKGASAEVESSIDEAKVGLIAGAPGVAQSEGGRPQALGELIALVILQRVDGGFSNVVMRGVPDDAVTSRPSMRIVEGRWARPGTDEVTVGKAIRARLKGLEVGQTLEMRKNRPMKIVGVFEDAASSNESEMWADVAVVRATFGQQSVVSSVRVRLRSLAAFDGFKASLEANHDLGVSVWRESEFGQRQGQGTAAFLSAMGFVLAFLFSIGAMIGAMITMHTTVAQRQREIGTLRAIGFSRGQILASLLVEALVLALVGGVLGAGASLLMSLRRVSMMNVATWSELSFRFEPTPKILLTAIGAAAAMGILGGCLPAIRAARLDVVQAMRGA